MENYLYIYVLNEFGFNHYMLCLKETHYCLASCSDLNKMRDMIKYFVKTYKSGVRLIEAITFGGYKVPEKTKELREEYFNSCGDIYSDFIREAVKEAKEEEKNNTLYNKVKRIKKSIISSPAISDEISAESKKENTVIKKKNTLIKKPVLLKV